MSLNNPNGNTVNNPSITAGQAVGRYKIPVGATGSGVLSTNPTRVLIVRNRDSVPQGARVHLHDCAVVTDISPANHIGAFELGASYPQPWDTLCSVGLCYAIDAGSIAGSTGALNSVYSVDVTYANK